MSTQGVILVLALGVSPVGGLGSTASHLPQVQPGGASVPYRRPRLCSQRDRARAVVLSVAKQPNGLVNSESCDKFYARRLTAADAKNALAEGKLYAAAELDAVDKGFNSTDEYLHNVSSAARHFIYSRKVHDRGDLIEALGKVIAEKGLFAMVLGSKDSGKSLVKESLVNATNKNATAEVLLLDVDARGSGPDLSAGIIQAVIDTQDSDLLQQFLGTLRDNVPVFEKLLAEAVKVTGGTPGVSALLELFERKRPTAVQALKSFVQAAERRGLSPVLLVDEANLVFDTKRSSAAGVTEENLQALDLLVSWTKQKLRMTAVFFSSEHGFPYKLAQSNFNPVNVKRTIHAGEVPPKEMRELLTDMWGMGDALADGLMAAYGGHIYLTWTAVRRLQEERELFTPFLVTPEGMGEAIDDCLDAEATHPGITKIMRQLAVEGFAKVKRSDPVAEMLVEKNVAGSVQYQHTVIGLPREVWKLNVKRHKSGLIPMLQMTRVLLLDELPVNADADADADTGTNSDVDLH